MESTRIIDISPLISSRIAVFPGDEKFKRTVTCDMKKGDGYTLSSITTTVHLGAHADAPSHFYRDGQTIEERSLELYIGPCQVLHLQGLRPGQRIRPEDIAKQSILAPRVLFYTGSYKPDVWSDQFNSLSPELIHYLHEKGVVLVGIDTPSVDPADSKMMESHAMIAQYDLAVLEGIVLDHVKEGLYELIALPLKLESADASPVRAILRAISV